jgi:hypothetical protein
VDIANLIIYNVDSIEASANVTSVVYVGSTAPVLSTAKKLRVESAVSNALLKTAGTVMPEKERISLAKQNVWHHSTENDELHGRTIEHFHLDGEYVERPNRRLGDIPPFVSVMCIRGQFAAASLTAGALLDTGEAGGDIYYKIGDERARIEAIVTDNYESMWIPRANIVGPAFIRKLVNAKEALLGVHEFQAGEIVIHFAMPKV